MSYSSRNLRVFLLASAALLAACSDSSTPTKSADVPAAAASTSCVTPQTIAIGQVAAGLSGTSTCIGGVSAAAEYALVAFNGDTTSKTATFNVSADGTTIPSASADLLTSSSSMSSLPLASSINTYQPSRAFEMGLRMQERAALPSLISGARRWAKTRTSGRAAYDVIPNNVSVGQILTLNSNAKVACGSPIYHAARVVAVTNKAIVVADTLNPTGGYTDAEYAAVGATFDTLIDPLDRAAFGDPSDIDGNGRIVMFFTKAVNDLTPSGSSSYVGGFFFARDLFPPVATADNDACTGSNKGEMFYLMVPDASRGGAFTKSNVTTQVTGTVAHEYQHLINASRRMYVNNADDFEQSWLDEGLAHIAEELLFYRQSGLSPRQNIDVTTVRSSSTIRDAFNNYASSNFGRYNEYLSKPSTYSPIATNDSLATRGAIWSFLRYAADHQGSSDGTTFYKLVNSTTSGFSNLQNVFGSGIINELRDWGTSVISDDVSGVTAQFAQPSWNFRSIYAALTNSSSFPLVTSALTSGSSKSVSLIRGSNSYLRFAVAAGGSANVQWAGAPANVQFSLVRLK